MPTSLYITRSSVKELAVLQVPVTSYSRSASDSSFDMDEEGGVSIEEIMGFSDFNGTKREPKHDKKSRGGRTAGSISTGANSQPVAVRQSTEMIGRSASSETKSIMSATANHFTPNSHIPASLQPRPLQPISNSLPQAISDSGQVTVMASGKRARSDSLPQFDTAISPQLSTSTLQTFISDDRPTVGGGRVHARATHSNGGRFRDPDAVGYTNPKSGISMTNAELTEYARGKNEKMLNANGEEYETKVYFQPSFLEDPWAGL